MKAYEFLDHTADVKFQAYGATLEEVFSNAALALTRLMYPDNVKVNDSLEMHIAGRDLESLLYNFLEEFLVLFDSRNFLLAGIEKIKIDRQEFKLVAEAVGDRAVDYEIHRGIKAVTYSDMFVRQDQDAWIAQVVLDV
ncbi:MAG: archease [Fidelibacterota bacterium]|nr:MAG: archease [Candidatus Neomarinimicrobiota bacterium]